MASPCPECTRPAAIWPVRAGLLLLVVLSWSAVSQADTLTVYAAASLTPVLTELVPAFERRYPRDQIRLSFAGPATLARQIEQGGAAGVFISADQDWMNYLQQRNLIVPDSRFNLLGNQLVLIQTQRPSRHLLRSGQPVATQLARFQGRLCLGMPESVPAGRYARQALQTLKLWAPLQKRIVPTQDVRAALTLVERGECELGVVYLTDAQSSRQVQTLTRFGAGLHQTIIYPMAVVAGRADSVRMRQLAQAFSQYLQSADAASTFARYGFTPLAVRSGLRPR